jgi:exopolyphosphatase
MSLPLRTTHHHYVVGNESCDLDSVVSALVLARHYRAHLTQDSADNDDDGDELVDPLLPCRRAEFALRVDSLAVLSAAALAELRFLHDDVSLAQLERLHADARLRLTLVDHNRCVLPAPLADAVVGVVDHHELTRQHAPARLQLQLVRRVGSCCTLVGQLVAHAVTPSDAELLLRTIAVDTMNFDAALRRATPLDVAVARFLHRVAAPPLAFEPFCAAAFALVRAAKDDVAAVPLADLLRRDYKSLPEHRLGLSSVPVPAARFDERVLAEFCADAGVDSLIVFAALTEPPPIGFRRELAVYSRDRRLFAFFGGGDDDGDDSRRIQIFSQDVTESRKVVVPKLLAALNS